MVTNEVNETDSKLNETEHDVTSKKRSTGVSPSSQMQIVARVS